VYGVYFRPRRSAMSAPDINSSVERARHLIPGYLKKTLGADDSEWMAQYLSSLSSTDSTMAAELTSEIAWVAHTQAQLTQAEPAFDVQSGWRRMQGKLDGLSASAQATPAAAAHRPRGAWAWVKSQARARVDKLIRMWQKPVVAAMASAMIIGQMGILAAVVRYTYNVEPQVALVSPAAGSKVDPDSVVLAIVFKDTTTVKQMNQLLGSVQAQVVSGPGAIGVWEVAVPKDKLAAAMKLFGSSKLLESVAPP
jgi:hypothetical protein